jgi:hypothetical protein
MLCVVAGCAARTTIATNKDESYTREPARLMVIESMGAPLGEYTKSFQDTLSKHIKDCHVFTNYVITPAEMSSPTLSLDDKAVKDWLAKRDAFIARFRPDTVLAIAETQYTRRTLSRNGVPISTSVPEIVYELALTDVPSKKNVWKAQVTLHTGIGAGNDPGAKLADDIVARLDQEGIFHGCPATAAPPAPNTHAD